MGRTFYQHQLIEGAPNLVAWFFRFGWGLVAVTSAMLFGPLPVRAEDAHDQTPAISGVPLGVPYFSAHPIVTSTASGYSRYELAHNLRVDRTRPKYRGWRHRRIGTRVAGLITARRTIAGFSTGF